MLFFFFPAPEKKNSLLRLSQSVRYKLFQEKKNKLKKKTTFGKKKTPSNFQKWEKGKFWGIDPQVFLKNCLLHSLFTDFMLIFFLSLESVEVKLFQVKKKNLVLFFFRKSGKKKKQKFSQMS